MVKIPDSLFYYMLYSPLKMSEINVHMINIVLNSRSRSEAPSSKQIDSVCSILDQCVLSP